jgi:N-acetylmuramoyl-L-alanine amidase
MLPIGWRTASTSRRILFGTLILGAAVAASLAPGHALAETPSDRAHSATSRSSKALHGTTESTRFVIGLPAKADFQVFSLSHPNRVIVDLPNVKMLLPPEPGKHAVGLVRSFRGGTSAPGRARVVIDVTVPVVVEKAAMENDGHASRLVLDIVPAVRVLRQATNSKRQMPPGASGLGMVGVQPPLPRPAERPEVQAAKAYRPIIVLDPGHGGHDSGARKHGTVEKDVVLAFGKMLRNKLNGSGRYRVLMTRDDDTFVELSARREFAEKHKAALFIAIHADYANQSARGATIYSLRENVAESLKKSTRGLVRKIVLSNSELTAIKADAGGASAVKGFLADLAQREVDANHDRTSVFARSVIEYMGRSTNMKDNPDRSAAFAVLKTAQVPAVLIELAYVTNQQDAQNLKSKEWRDRVTASIMTAIDNYFADNDIRVPM